MKSILISFFLMAILFACSDKKMALNTFTEFPEEIDGCACYFSNNEQEFNEKQYIYADDYHEWAFVTIDGQVTKFRLEKSDTLSGKRSIETFTNENFKLTISVKQIGQGDETWQKVGVMVIKGKNGSLITKEIYGECGC